jgi:hypothetical protein
LRRSLRQDHFSSLGLISILKAKKIDPTGQILGIKPEFVPSGRLMTCMKFQQFLSEEIEDSPVQRPAIRKQTRRKRSEHIDDNYGISGFDLPL